MNDWARRTADKYITRKGNEPGQSTTPRTYAEAAWRRHAEEVHRFLRKHAATPEGASAIAALERIGEAIALDEKDGRRRA
jgi:hypothetical protein